MRPIISVFATIVTVILLNAQAFATTVTWVDQGAWQIVGDSEISYCHLIINYEDNDQISVLTGEGVDNPAMGFRARNLRPLAWGASFIEASLTFSNGAYHQIVAEVMSQNVAFANVPHEAIGNFANTRWMEVRVRGLLIGTYDLAGTNNMVTQLAQCVQAMRGEPF